MIAFSCFTWQPQMQTFEKGGANCKYFAQGVVNFQKIQIFRANIGA